MIRRARCSCLIMYVLNVDGAAAVETLRAELARAKEQARSSNAATLKASGELRAEQAAHCESKEKIAKMVVELKDAADRYQLLEEENWAKVMDLERPRWRPNTPAPKLERGRRS